MCQYKEKHRCAEVQLIGFFATPQLKHRAIVVLVGISLALHSFLYLTYLLDIPLPRPIESVGMIGTMAAGILLPVSTLILGFASTSLPIYRFLVVAAVLILYASAGGWLENLGLVAAFLAIVAMAIFFFAILVYPAWKMGQEDAQRIREGKRPKYDALFDPNNPYGLNKKK